MMAKRVLMLVHTYVMQQIATCMQFRHVFTKMFLEPKGLNGTSVLARRFRSAYTAEEGRGNTSDSLGSCG